MFDMLVDGKTVRFHSAKAKELMALCVWRNESPVTIYEIVERLWGEELAEVAFFTLSVVTVLNHFGKGKNAQIRFSHENPDVQALYAEYLEKPLGHKSHHLLHTDHHGWEMPLNPKLK